MYTWYLTISYIPSRHSNIVPNIVYGLYVSCLVMWSGKLSCPPQCKQQAWQQAAGKQPWWEAMDVTRKWAIMPSSSSTRTPMSVRCLPITSTSWCPNCRSSTSSHIGTIIVSSAWRWHTSFIDIRCRVLGGMVWSLEKVKVIVWFAGHLAPCRHPWWSAIVWYERGRLRCILRVFEGFSRLLLAFLHWQCQILLFFPSLPLPQFQDGSVYAGASLRHGPGLGPYPRLPWRPAESGGK